MNGKTSVFTPQLLAEIVDNINRFLPQFVHRPAPEGDDVYEHIRNLKFPVSVRLVSGKPSPGLHPSIDCFSAPMPEHMQRPKIVCCVVCATVAFAWVKGLDLSVLVNSDEDHVGFAFSPDKGPDDVLITPHVETGTGGEVLR